MRKLLLLAALFYISLGVACYAQQYNFRTYSIEDGLPQSDIYDIIQDSRGYIWMSTNGGGVCRFDGVNLKIINKKNGLPGNVVRRMLEDSKGNIWFATDAGIAIYDGNKMDTVNVEDSLTSDYVICLFEDSRGIVWAGTSQGGLNEIRLGENGKHIVKAHVPVDYLSEYMIFDIAEDNKNRLWIATYGGGIIILDFSKEEVSTEVIQKIKIPSDHILSIAPDNNGDMWIGSYDGGAFKINNSTGPDSAKVVYTELNSRIIWDVIPLESGEVWFASNDHGLISLNNDVYEFYDENNGLPNNQILSVFEDAEGNIWAGTMGSGAAMFLGKELIHYSEHEGLSKNQVTNIVQDKEGYFWVATYGGGVAKCDFSKDSIVLEEYTVDNGLKDNIVTALGVDKDNNIWIGTSKEGVCMFNGKEFTNHFTIHEGLPVNNIVTILVDSENILWLGTIGGISMYDGVGIISHTESGNGLPELFNEVQTIIESKDGTVWFGTLGGLGKTMGASMYIYDEVDGLLDIKVWSLTEDNSGNIWIGTFGGGLYMLDPKSTDSIPIKFIADDAILSSNNLHSLIFEDDNTLIVGTNQGIDRITFDDSYQIVSAKSYDLTNGFSSGETKQNAIHRDEKGDIWIGTVKGITKFSPKFARTNTKAPQSHITNLKLRFEETDWLDKTGKKMPWYNLPADLSLSYEDNHLTFEFSGISFSNPEKIFYKYRMEGLEADWSPPRKDIEAVYSGLAPGEYTFNIIAENEDNIWNEEPVTFSFVITPPFWKTTWFIVLCIVLAIVIIISYIKFREKQLIREKQILEQKVKERTFEIEQQKEEIEAQRDEIEGQRDQIEDQLRIVSHQKDMITEQQKEIVDSIHYAKRIQTAILPPQEAVDASVPEHFILFRPKDIVSGDFYWAAQKDDKLVIAAADCTGHGVPGAFMSMLGVTFLNQVVLENGETRPGEILNDVRENVINSLQQKGMEGEQKDGMDMALCTIDHGKNLLQFAGANNPLYLIRDGELIETKGDKMPVAIHIRMDDFESKDIELKKGDTFYMFSDGFADQFGGPKGKKFKYKPFKELLLSFQDKPMSEQKEILFKVIEEWRAFPDPDTGEDHYEQIDDIVVIGLRIT